MDRLLIKHKLLDKHLTLAALARRSGMPYDRLIRIVHGYRKARQDEMEAIAAALGISVSQLGGESLP